MTDHTPTLGAPLVVGTNADTVWKAFRPGIILAAILIPLTVLAAVGFAAAMGESLGFLAGALAALPLIAFSFLSIFYAMYLTSSATARAAMGTVLTLSSTGLASTIPQGTLELPWQAVDSVRVKKAFSSRILIYTVADGVHGDTPGVHTTMKPAAFRRLSKVGFHLGSVGIDVPVETILEATARFTDGRLVPR